MHALRGDNIAYVKFTKTNGEVRRMQCTRNPNHIPAAFAPKPEPKIEAEKKPIVENLEVINAFDVEKQGWRSFRVDSVTEYGFEPKN